VTFKQQILPPELGLPPTTVWGYGSIHHPATFASPSCTIEARWRRPVRVKWINDLKEPRTGHEIPLVIQDRSFNDDGSLFYPNSRGLPPRLASLSFCQLSLACPKERARPGRSRPGSSSSEAALRVACMPLVAADAADAAARSEQDRAACGANGDASIRLDERRRPGGTAFKGGASSPASRTHRGSTGAVAPAHESKACNLLCREREVPWLGGGCARRIKERQCERRL
jgi:hypothetical protein